MTRSRRRFLGGLFAGIAALGTGCVGSTGSDGTPTATNDGSRSTTAITLSPTTATTTTTKTATTPTESSQTSTATEPPRPTASEDTTNDVPVRKPPACDSGVQRLSYPIDEVRYGSLGGFALTASEETVARGETISFRLENATDSKQYTGNKRKYDIQRRTDGGWRSIYWVPDKYGYNDVGIQHSPGNGFTWSFPFARGGLERPTQFNTPYSVCDSVVPGEYRFVYWGVGSEQERKSNYEKEYAIGVRFTVEQP